jgi:flagellar basal body-associated protein FliL
MQYLWIYIVAGVAVLALALAGIIFWKVRKNVAEAEARQKSKLKKQWVWSGHRPADIIWWADLPKLPGGY